MLENFLSFFKKTDSATIAEIEKLPSLISVKEALNNYFVASDDPDEDNLAHQLVHGQNTIDYLHNVFDTVNNALESSALHVQAAQAWRIVLRELLVNVPYRGEFVGSANKIKEDLDNHGDLLNSSKQVKQLVIDYSNSLCDNQAEIQQYLVSTATKLQAIYQEISEAKDEYFSRESSALKINNTFEKGMLELNHSIQQHNDLEALKNNMNAIVKAIQTRVVEEVESEESGTKILERKIAGMSDKIKSLENHTQDLENAIREKHLEAITDPLTGLLNRAAYVQALEKSWMDWEQNQVPSTMLVWDIDHFKMINDRHGHAAGDKVLQSVAAKLKANVQESDTLARFGGEEFVMLLNGKTIEEGGVLAEEIRQLIANTDFTYKKNSLFVTISCGIASFISSDTPTTLFERADKALYKAKRNGRDRVEILKVA